MRRREGQALVREGVYENTKAGILSLKELQQQTNKKEIWEWLEHGCQIDNEWLWCNTTTGWSVAPSGILFLKCIMDQYINRLLTCIHVKTTWWGKGMLRTFRDWVKRCVICAQHKIAPTMSTPTR